VVQQVQGESQGKQPVAEPSTPYPGSTSAPGNTGMLYLGNTTAPGNPGNIASTSTLHLGNTSGNVIYVDATSPYLWGVLMGNLATSLIANLPYLGSASTLGNPGFPAHTTPTNRLMVPTYLPRVRVFLIVIFPTYFSLGHRLMLHLTRG
jgi:hypothetical protein